MKRTRVLAVLALVALAAAGGWWRFGGREAPAGQPPLATIDPVSIGALRDDFNRAAGQTRLIVLLSPT
jgi:hypothetical protein